MHASEEIDLVEQAQGGNRQAISRLLAGCYPRLLRTARSLLGDSADAQDAVQEAAVAVFEKIHQLQNPAAFKAWSNTVLRRACSNYLSSRQSHRMSTVSFDEASIDRVSRSGDHWQEIRTELANIFGHAGASMREILLYRLVLGLSVSETAAVLGLSEGAVKLRLHRARRKAVDLAGS